MSNTQSCRDSSSSAGEHLYGTVPRVEHWFLLEYRDHWAKEFLDNSSVPDDVKKELNELLRKFPRSRLQLIKSDEKESSDISFYYINSSEFKPKCHKFTLRDYGDIPKLGLQGLIENGDIVDSATDEKLALVCTHGAYDSCCGKYGVHIYEQLKEVKELTVWKSTHVGSHRFSANVVLLPEGIYYGRVGTDNLGEIVETHLRGEIYLDCFRGRSCYSQPSQVCDFFLRRELKKYGIFDIRWEYEKDRDLQIAVEFKIEGENIGYSVNAIVFNNAFRIKTSCGDEEPTAIHQFYFYSLIPYIPKEKKEG